MININDEIDENLVEKYETEIAGIFDKLKEDSNIGDAIEHIFDESIDIEEVRDKLILLIQKYSNILPSKKILKIQNKQKTREHQIAEDLIKFTQDLTNKYKNQQMDDGKSTDQISKMNYKKKLKEFAIYEVYKVMSPKRIAGETKKDNYIHNMMIGGEKRASHYEGGSKADLKSYGTAEVKKIKNASNSFNKGGRTL